VDSAGYSQKCTGGEPLTRERFLALNPSTIAEQALMMHLHKNEGYTIDRFIDSILRGENVVDGKLGELKLRSW